ncbi:alkylphosphonate utilization protein [Formicincola oecophyllae]|uniref:Alkylphosphonate utilization protein n=1 Tax=Formicincola oecophyllae TaxID=2558361 RepID=A0A4Y6U799_9PROT|nr:zinc ribbon domain-containing protein YjdM [Formicincola oecophyllae]QDH13273.1 alkylphosphonate utilization protein [Formicincola oecophyllae]
MAEPHCPQCNCEYPYPDGALMVCPECAHEWNPDAPAAGETDHDVIRDANGNPLADGDTVVLVKDLKVKGSSQSIKGGTKVKNIRLGGEAAGHDISCKIPGFGAMELKAEFVRKAT